MPEPRKALVLKRFLVATDLSARAEKAVARAVQLAKEHRATLTVLHVRAGEAGHETRTQQIVRKIEEDLARKVEALHPRTDGSTTIRALAGTPFVEIIRQGRKEAVDLILVGAHGAQFIKDLLFGTTAEKIVRKGDRPVLVVKRSTPHSYRRVLVPVDFSENSRHALEFALRLAPQAQFYVLHAYDGLEGQLWRAGLPKSEIMHYRHQLAKERRLEMKRFLRHTNSGRKPILRLLRHGRAPHVITGTVRRLHPDLVSVGSAGRTGLPYILLGSVAEHVLREVSCDVLVARSGSIRFELP
jgi:nucleotide-binding universal stress UspA family protein